MEKSNVIEAKPLMDLAVLMSAIGIIGRTSIKTESQIQHIAVQCIAQSIVHRNSTPARELYENLPKGFRHDALAAYFERFGNLAYAVDAKSANKAKTIVFYDVEKHENKVLSWSPLYEIEVESFHWTKGTPKKDPTSIYDADEAISKMLEKLNKHASDSTKTVKHRDLLDAMIKAYNAWSFEQGSENIGFDNGEGDNTQAKLNASATKNAAIRELLDDAEVASLLLVAKAA